jgi:hypothetical protein
MLLTLAPSNKMTVEALFDLTIIVKTATDKTVHADDRPPHLWTNRLLGTTQLRARRRVTDGGPDRDPLGPANTPTRRIVGTRPRIESRRAPPKLLQQPA